MAMHPVTFDFRDMQVRKLADMIIHCLRDYIAPAAMADAREELYRCAYQAGVRLTDDPAAPIPDYNSFGKYALDIEAYYGR